MTRRENIIVRLPAITLSLVAVFLLWHTFDPVYASLLSGLQFGPVFFPRIILTIWLCLAVPMIFVVPLTMRDTILESRKYWPGIAFFLTLGVYLWLMPRLGYLISTFLFSVALQFIAGERKIVSLLVWSVALSGLSWFCFEHLLEIILPSGKWI